MTGLNTLPGEVGTHPLVEFTGDRQEVSDIFEVFIVVPEVRNFFFVGFLHCKIGEKETFKKSKMDFIELCTNTRFGV